MNRLKVLHICSASIDSGAFKGALALHESMQNSDRVESRFLGQICPSDKKGKIYSYFEDNKKKNLYLSLLNRFDQLILKDTFLRKMIYSPLVGLESNYINIVYSNGQILFTFIGLAKAF